MEEEVDLTTLDEENGDEQTQNVGIDRFASSGRSNQLTELVNDVSHYFAYPITSQ